MSLTTNPETRSAVIVPEPSVSSAHLSSRIRQVDPRYTSFLILPDEGRFTSDFPKIAARKPDIFVLGMIARWGLPTEDTPIPNDVVKTGMWYAGRRMERLIHTDPNTRDTPVVIYSTLSEQDLRVAYDQKPDPEAKLQLPPNTYWVEHSASGLEVLRTILSHA